MLTADASAGVTLSAEIELGATSPAPAEQPRTARTRAVRKARCSFRTATFARALLRTCVDARGDVSKAANAHTSSGYLVGRADEMLARGCSAPQATPSRALTLSNAKAPE
eukprot:scaffold114505_cov26-Tisochrysis_lutea.AAC.2